VTNSAGAVVELSADNPYGMNTSTIGPDPSPMHFTGMERDWETQMSHALNREYPMKIGRWLTADPAGKGAANLEDPQTWNLYAYVRNNPMSLTDPTGLAPLTPDPASSACPPHAAGCGGGPPGAAEDQAEIDAQHQAEAEAIGEQRLDQQQTAQSQAAQVPGAVKAAIMNSVSASNAPSGADTTGGFHEESGVAGTTTAGALVVSPDKPGPYSNPDTSDHASTTHTAVGQDQRNSIANVTVMWHVHPSGQTATHNWNQPPSGQDRSVVVPGPINIVVGARNKTVYFYDGGNMNLHMSLKQFMGAQ
jgi:RHS repeat-associated protein